MDDPQRIWDRLIKSAKKLDVKEEFKEDLKTLCTFLTECGPVFITGFSNLGVFNTLCKLENEVKNILSEKGVSEAIDCIKDHCPKNEGSTDIFEKVWKECEKLPDKDGILGVMDKFKVEQANNMITDMVRVSMLVSIFQFFKILKAWNTITEASNYVKDSKKFDLVKKELEKMREILKEIVSMYEQDPNNSCMDRKITYFNTKYTATCRLIDCEKVKIDGHIKEVGLLVDSSMIDGATNAASAGIQGYQLFKAWEYLTGPSKIVGFVSLFAALACSVANLKVYNVSNETLQNLRRELNEVNRLQDEIQFIHREVQRIMDESNNA